MAAPELIWRGDWPAEVRGAVEPYLIYWKQIVPAWCAEVIVRWDPDLHENSMMTQVRPEYRDTILVVGPGWIDMEDESRDLTVVHELAHIITGPLVNFIRSTIRAVTDDGMILREVLEEQARVAFESVVEDQARIIRRLLKSPDFRIDAPSPMSGIDLE